MKKTFLLIAVIMTIAASAFAAAGDKIYFINSQNWERIDVREYKSDWADVSYGAAVALNRGYNGYTIYSYTIQNDDCAFIVATDWTNWTSNSGGIAPVADCYYMIDGTTADGYWLTMYYYNEFYFMDNNTTVFASTPNIVLYDNNWAVLNGSWPGQAMTAIGTVMFNGNSYQGYKYLYLTTEECTKVNFNDGTTDWSEDVNTGNKFYSWGNWYTMSQVADQLTLAYATNTTATNWVINENMWWNNTNNRYEVTVQNIYFPEAGDYKYRTLMGHGENLWNARFPNSAAEDWFETINITTAGYYDVVFTYDPATDLMTAVATLNDNYYRAVTCGNFGTICFPYEASYTGATFYTIASRDNDDATAVTSLTLEEVEGNLVAGKPYIFKANSDYIHLYYTGDAVAAPVTVGNNGLVGSFTEQTIDEYDGSSVFNFILYNNSLYAAGAWTKVGQYRAYINMTDVPAGVTPVPGRRYVRMYVGGNQAPTAVETVEQEASQVTKQIVDGQIVIVRDGVRYNAIGTRL